MLFKDFLASLQKVKLSFKKVEIPLAWVTLALGFAPFIPVGKSLSAILIPPIKSMQDTESATYVGAVIAAVLLSFHWQDTLRKNKRCLPVLIGIMVALLFGQLAFRVCLVHSQHNADSTIPVVTGFVRRQKTIDIYGDASADEILEKEIAQDEAITVIWKPWSVYMARGLGIGLYALLGATGMMIIATFALRGDEFTFELPDDEKPKLE